MMIWKRLVKDWVQETSFADALMIDFSTKQVIAAVGGGGKTSTLQQLAAELRIRGKKVILTTTTHMAMPEAPEILSANPDFIRERLEQDHFALVGHSVGNGKMAGVSKQLYYKLCSLADVVLVEADGSKQMPLKLPASHEPVIPENATQVLVLAGMSALGQTIADSCHRKELVMKLLGKDEEHQVQPEDIARMIQQGYWMPFVTGSGLSGTVILNQADDVAHKASAMSVATLLDPIPCLITQLH